MQVHSCGVDGCQAPARWERVSKADADLHATLCSDHWKLLHDCNWIAAAAYRPVSTKPEGILVDTSLIDADSAAAESR